MGRLGFGQFVKNPEVFQHQWPASTPAAIQSTWLHEYLHRRAATLQLREELRALCTSPCLYSAVDALVEHHSPQVCRELLAEVDRAPVSPSVDLTVKYYGALSLHRLHETQLLADWEELIESSVLSAHPADIEHGALLIGQCFTRTELVVHTGRRLDQIAEDIRLAYPAPITLPQIIEHLFGTLGLRGNQSDYYSPLNSMLNQVLDTKKGIPITLAVILQAVSHRFNIAVDLIGIPSHMLAHHNATYYDCFEKGRTLTREGCNQLLASFGHTLPIPDHYFTPMHTHEILGRMLKNLLLIFQEHEDPTDQPPQSWVMLFRLSLPLMPREPQLYTMLLQHYMQLERYADAIHLLNYYQRPDLAQKIECLRDKNQVPIKPKRQPEDQGWDNVKYQVGTIIQHARYHYRGVIYGVDPICKAEPDWQLQMNVAGLSEGAGQPFYNVLVDQRDRPSGQTTYVAQQNIIVPDHVEASSMLGHGDLHNPELGKYFRYLDLSSHLAHYVPNAATLLEYPNECVAPVHTHQSPPPPLAGP
eukprot:NODE_949_length_1747_cov_33.133951_g889_i0.p1 GENE.NODE_949_length_1747_cov_33.133951_g889_i0~~NODE_949_length_1747_cov_33.133951_g889_i0.p1  ORF type:complete len:554 (-),score=83.58 NODE_949_length_1747_cov_33.133951_g889_i0:86-1675(-)